MRQYGSEIKIVISRSRDNFSLIKDAEKRAKLMM